MSYFGSSFTVLYSTSPTGSCSAPHAFHEEMKSSLGELKSEPIREFQVQSVCVVFSVFGNGAALLSFITPCRSRAPSSPQFLSLGVPVGGAPSPFIMDPQLPSHNLNVVTFRSFSSPVAPKSELSSPAVPSRLFVTLTIPYSL